MRLRRPLLLLAALLVASSIALGGCGGGKDVEDVRACLERAKLETKGIEGEDRKKLEDAVTASFTSDDELAFGAAAVAKSQDDADEFERETAKGTEKMEELLGDEGTFKAGVDGRYVWAYGGTKDSDKVEAAKECVEP